MPETLDLLEENLLHDDVPPFDLEIEHVMAVARLACLPTEVEDYARCSDEQLTSILGIISEHERMLAGHKAVVVGLVAERSRPELGLTGLAQSKGHRSAEEFLRTTTGSSAPEAKRTLELGRVVVEAAAQPDPATGVLPDAVAAWLHGAARALQAGQLSAEQFRSIRDGLGRPQQDVTVGMLAEAVARLVHAARELDADALRALAREVRDELDEAGIADREAALLEQRSFRITRLPDGMSRVSWLLDPLSAAVVHELFDRVTSPKLGGPRFVDPEKVERAQAVEQDPRTPFQYASDVMLELLRQGVDHDPSRLLGSEPPAVRVGVLAEVLETRTRTRLPGGHQPAGVDRDRRAARLRPGHAAGHLRPGPPTARRGSGPSPLHQEAADRDGGARRRVPDVRQTPLLDGSASHQALGSRSRVERHRRRSAPLPGLPSAGASRALGDRAWG